MKGSSLLSIVGLSTRTKPLGTITVACRQCLNPSAHQLSYRQRIVTLFSLPVLPLRRQAALACSYCGFVGPTDPDQVPSLLAYVHGPMLIDRPGDLRQDEVRPGRHRLDEH